MDIHLPASQPVTNADDSQQCNRLHHKGGNQFFARRGARRNHAARHNVCRARCCVSLMECRKKMAARYLRGGWAAGWTFEFNELRKTMDKRLERDRAVVALDAACASCKAMAR
ncbi:MULTISPECIES: hypothetical protein [Stenotrophomonas]|uniref:hypothetical protein n=1 Tax=Stenotrophomonas TaxID=40323 RepID=UPI0012E3878E|nr:MULTISPECIES: hypothetical protein [Stenotrophomonas]